MAEIKVDHVARIEGHGNITVSVEEGVVADVRLDVVEPARFFESMVVGRRYDEAPLITSRICGICSPNHQLTSIKALEAAMGVRVTERTTLLRKLLVYGSYLQNHATHLYLFAAPDYAGNLGSVFPLAATHPDVVERALRIKKLGNELTAIVGGRPVHPVTAVVGGFTHEPDAAALAGFRDRLRAVAEDARATVDLFRSFEYPDFETSGEMLALVDDEEYAIYDGAIGSLEGGWRKPVVDYRSVLAEEIVSHSNAKHSRVDGNTVMVGALPRLNLSAALLTPLAADALSASGLSLPSRNPFLNNVAQAIELVDAAERCAGWIERLAETNGSTMPDFEVHAGEGSAATEAPRGTLYHSYTLDADGRVLAANVVTPTAQSLGNLDADMRAFAPTVVGEAPERFQLLLEELVRSYDPCLSCSVH
jgi:sulfhydrogenase subunit alpha